MGASSSVRSTFTSSDGRGVAVTLAVAASVIVVTIAALAVPSRGADPCAPSLDGASATAGDLQAALDAVVTSGCPAGHIELTGTFPLTASLTWSGTVPLTIAGPSSSPGATARLEAVPAAGAPAVAHRILTASTASPVTLERLVLTGGDRSAGDVNVAGDAEGGAVLAEDLRLIDVELVGNEAVLGGAVSIFTLTAERTSFVGNVAAFASGEGGAVYALDDVTLTNVTFAGNSAGEGGAIWMDETATLVASAVTFLGNSAGAAVGGADLHRGVLLGGSASTVTLRGVLLGGVAEAGGTPPASVGPSCGGQDLAADGVLTWSESRATDASCGAPAGDVIARPTFTTVPFLTGTTALPVPDGAWPGRDRLTCPAAGLPAFDQRGVARPQGSKCDVGAVEQVVAPPPPPPPPADDTPVAAEGEAEVAPPVPTSVPAGGGGCADGCPAPRGR